MAIDFRFYIDFAAEKGLRYERCPGGGELMNRNVTIVVILLVLVVIVGYLVWLRSRVQPTVTPQVEEQVEVTPTIEPTMTASPSATPGKEATGSVKQKISTPSSVGR